MSGPRYCVLCGVTLAGGRVDKLYCGANCRTRACRMRKRGEPISPKSAPQPVSLASLLSDGVPCPCCGVRIVIHATAAQAGAPQGYTVAAAKSPHPRVAQPGTLRSSSNLPTPRSRPRGPQASPTISAGRDSVPPNAAGQPISGVSRHAPPVTAEAERRQRPTTTKPTRLPVNASGSNHPPRQAPGPSGSGAAAQGAGGLSARPPASTAQQLVASTRQPSAPQVAQQLPQPSPPKVRAAPSNQPTPLPTAASTSELQRRPVSAVAPSVSSTPPRVLFPAWSGLFNNWGMPLPGYEIIGEDPRRLIYATATTKLRGDPWSPGGDVLESLVSDILRVIENELVQNRYPIAQKARAWFQAQHETLILLGVRIGRTAHALWKPEYAFGIFFELGVLATERALSDLAAEYSSERTAIQHWSSAYERLVHVLGVSVTAALGLGGALGRLIIDDEVDDDSGPAEAVVDGGEGESTEDWPDDPAPYGTSHGEKIFDESEDEEQEDDNEDEDANAGPENADQLEEDEGNDEEDNGRNEEWDGAGESEDVPSADDGDSEDNPGGEGIATGNSREDAAYEYEDNGEEGADKSDGEDEWDK